MEKLTKKEEIFRCGFSRIQSGEMLSDITENEAVAIYKEPMLRYGIDCGCPFTEEEVVAYIKKEFASMKSLEEHTS